METTTTKTGDLESVGGTRTAGSTGTTEATKAADRVQGAADYVAQGAHDAVDRMAAKAGPALDRAGSAASDGATSVHTKYDDFIRSEDWVESARNEIRARPLAVVGVALVAGLLMGRLIS